MIIDYVTPEERVSPSHGVRARSVCMPRVPLMQSERGRYSWSAADTDVRRTWRRWAAETGSPLPGWLAEQDIEAGCNSEGMPWFLKKQAA